MKHPLHLLPLTALFAFASCQSTTQRLDTGPVDEDQRTELFGAVAALEGSWEREDPEGNVSPTTFAVSSAGSVVRETMFPGTPHEMTNMYSLDGDELVMTHYCAGGNQPSMRAAAMDAGSLPFRFESVRDLNDPDGTYMGEMTLVFLADGTLEQRWKGLKHGEVDPAHGMVFTLKRQ